MKGAFCVSCMVMFVTHGQVCNTRMDTNAPKLHAVSFNNNLMFDTQLYHKCITFQVGIDLI